MPQDQQTGITPPPGYALDSPSAQPKGITPPAGYTLDAAQSSSQLKTEQPPQDSTWNRIGQGVSNWTQRNIVAPAKMAFAPPQDMNETVAHAGGGDAGLVAYRVSKMMTNAVENAVKAPKEHFQNAKEEINRAANEFHKGDYRNAAASFGSAVEDASSVVPFLTPSPRSLPGSDVSDREKQIIEGTRPGGNLATPLTEAALDVASIRGGAALPRVTQKLGSVLETHAPDLANAFLKANRKGNYLYGKNPGKAIIDEGVNAPRSLTRAGQLENIQGQLESAGDRLDGQIKQILSDPKVASQKLDPIPTIKDSITDAKKYITQQTGVDVPKYLDALNKLEDSLLTKYDTNGKVVMKYTGNAKMSPAEVSDIKKSVGKNTQWNLNPQDPEFQMKAYVNSVRKQIYGKLADSVEGAAPEVGPLNARYANVIEAQGLLENRIALEHGSGGWAAPVRKGEWAAGLGFLLEGHPYFGLPIIANRISRSIPARVLEAQGGAGLGKSMQSGAAQSLSQAAGTAAKSAPVVGDATQRIPDLAWFQASDGKIYVVPPESWSEVQKVDPGAKPYSPGSKPSKRSLADSLFDAAFKELQ